MSRYRSATIKDLKKSLFVFKTNTKAPAARSRLRKKDPIISFMRNTATDRIIIGVEQYMIKHRVCRMALILENNYTSAPRRLALMVMMSGPSHMPMKRLVKASSI